MEERTKLAGAVQAEALQPMAEAHRLTAVELRMDDRLRVLAERVRALEQAVFDLERLARETAAAKVAEPERQRRELYPDNIFGRIEAALGARKSRQLRRAVRRARLNPINSVS